MLPTTASLVIDVRALAPHERHSKIFGSFDELLPGEAIEIVSDHDPLPLRRQFESRSARQFQWAYLQQGPDQWNVQISKVEVHGEGGACCGSCGG